MGGGGGGVLFVSICDVAKVADCPWDDRAKFGYNVQGNGLKQGASPKQVLAQGLLKGCLLRECHAPTPLHGAENYKLKKYLKKN